MKSERKECLDCIGRVICKDEIVPGSSMCYVFQESIDKIDYKVAQRVLNEYVLEEEGDLNIHKFSEWLVSHSIQSQSGSTGMQGKR